MNVRPESVESSSGQQSRSAPQRIAIVGGGPAGTLAASLLAEGGRSVLLFDEKLAWEKPCGGGLTYKALQQYPFLGEVGAESKAIEHCEIISPLGRKTRFHMQHPVAIFSRKTLNGLLLERARNAGQRTGFGAKTGSAVEVRQERITRISGSSGDWRLTTSAGEYNASYLVLANGARNAFRAQFALPFSREDLVATAGYFIPMQTALMQIQFLKGIAGYIWVFPRHDHVSAGIAGKMGEISTAALRRILEDWLDKNGYSLEDATFYAHILPCLRAQSFDSMQVSGDGWAMIGDSAGLVDPITGEGLYYALRSAELCAQALLAEQPETYAAALCEEVVSELKLAARVSQRFYSGQIFGDSVLEQMIALTEKSKIFRELMSDLFAGIQGYRDLRARMYRILPAVMAEGLAGTIKWPKIKSANSKGPEFAADPFAE